MSRRGVVVAYALAALIFTAVGVGCGSVARTQAPAVEIVGQPPASAGIPDAVRTVVADLEAFAARSGSPRRAAGGYLLVDSAGTRGVPPCLPQPAALTGTAMYCPQTDQVLVDSTALLPVMDQSYGPGALAFVLAHEFSHVYWPVDRPTAASEAAADCFAGAYLAERRAVGNLSRDDLDGALRMITDLAQVHPGSGAPGVYGVAGERRQDALDGINGGLGACAPPGS